MGVVDKRREEIHLILHGPLQTIVTTNECGPTVARSLNFSKVQVWDFVCVNLLEFENKPNKVQATGGHRSIASTRPGAEKILME